jgi:RNA polymerase sigma factor (sigma-70 family)
METVVNDGQQRLGTPDRAMPRLLGDEEELFRRHHRSLVCAVGRMVGAPAELIEDACQNAWVVLIRHQPMRTPALFAWLRTVAVHQAYRLSQRERRDARLEELGGDVGWEDLLGAAPSLETAVDARVALACLASLPPKQRHDLALLIGGFSYREIAATGSRLRSLNNVNKQLTKARARLRALASAA